MIKFFNIFSQKSMRLSQNVNNFVKCLKLKKQKKCHQIALKETLLKIKNYKFSLYSLERSITPIKLSTTSLNCIQGGMSVNKLVLFCRYILQMYRNQINRIDFWSPVYLSCNNGLKVDKNG